LKDGMKSYKKINKNGHLAILEVIYLWFY